MRWNHDRRLAQAFLLTGDRSRVVPRLATVGEALTFLEETSGGVPWDEALLAARLSITQAAKTGSANDVADATAKLERYLWAQQLI